MKFLKTLLTIAILGGLVYGTYYVIFQTDVFKVTNIEYNPNEALDIYELQRYSGIHYGDHIFKVDPEEAQAALERHPYVRSATITKSYPNTIGIEIVYRAHFLSVEYSDIILSLDNTLQVLKVLDDVEQGYVVEGMPFNAFATGKVIEVDAFYVLENIVKLIDLVDQSGIVMDQEINYDSNAILINCQGIRVNFGDGENIESRFNKFINIYQSLRKSGIESGIIDVSSDGLPVYRPFGE